MKLITVMPANYKVAAHFCNFLTITTTKKGERKTSGNKSRKRQDKKGQRKERREEKIKEEKGREGKRNGKRRE